jgi:hypothetical protein
MKLPPRKSRKVVVRLVRLGLALPLAFFVVSDLGCAALNFSLSAVRESLQSHPNPARDYGEAVSRFQKIQGAEGRELNPVCLSILLTHGKRTKRAVVLFHGLTNCPEQFRELGRTFYELGYNVLIPRLPRHGLADVALVTSQSDDSVSDSVTWRLVGLWRKKGLARFASVDFPKVMKIEHDMIDPAQKNQQTDIVYPVLVKLLNAP